MAKRSLRAIICLLCFCLSLAPCYARAASTTDAKEPILPENFCTLTISYGYDTVAFTDVPVKLYQIADVSANLQYTLTSAFADSGLLLNGIQSTGEWNVIRSTLESLIIADGIPEDFTAVTDNGGQVCFEALKPGLYLAVAGDVAQGDLTCCFDGALIALPTLGTDGLWQYQVAVTAKAQILPPVDPDSKIQLNVLKLWKGDEDRTDRPRSIEVEIFRDGTSYQTVTLSQENNWAYSWLVEEDGASWTVVERNVPDGYTMTVEHRGTSLVLVNTRNTEDDNPDGPPQTGDTANIMFFTVLMYVSGTILILLGIAGKRKQV